MISVLLKSQNAHLCQTLLNKKFKKWKTSKKIMNLTLMNKWYKNHNHLKKSKGAQLLLALVSNFFVIKVMFHRSWSNLITVLLKLIFGHWVAFCINCTISIHLSKIIISLLFMRKSKSAKFSFLKINKSLKMQSI